MSPDGVGEVEEKECRRSRHAQCPQTAPAQPSPSHPPLREGNTLTQGLPPSSPTAEARGEGT